VGTAVTCALVGTVVATEVDDPPQAAVRTTRAPFMIATTSFRTGDFILGCIAFLLRSIRDVRSANDPA
jgi:hypothetical protein